MTTGGSASRAQGASCTGMIRIISDRARTPNAREPAPPFLRHGMRHGCWHVSSQQCVEQGRAALANPEGRNVARDTGTPWLSPGWFPFPPWAECFFVWQPEPPGVLEPGPALVRPSCILFPLQAIVLRQFIPRGVEGGGGLILDAGRWLKSNPSQGRLCAEA